MPTPAPIPGPAGANGAAGAPGPAPSGTGLVSVTSGVLDTPTTLTARLTADASAARTALGIGQPPTLAAQAIAEGQRRRGPIAMRTVGTTGVYAATTPSTTPSVKRGSSGAITVYSPQAGGYSGMNLAQTGSWGSTGWYISASNSQIRVALIKAVNEPMDFTTAIATIGWHTVAWSISSDGATVRYSVDGADAATLTLSITPLTPALRDPNNAVYIGTNGSGLAVTPLGFAYLGFWESSVLSDSDLKILSGTPSAGAPNVTGIVGGAPTWEWAAAAYLGTNSVRIAGADWIVLGSPEWWMP